MTDTLRRSDPRIRLDPGWAGEHLTVAGVHIAIVYQLPDGRWYVQGAGMAQEIVESVTAGYASRDRAILDAIRQWETRVE